MPQPITVLVGPARCGKTHFLLGQYREVLQTGGQVTGRALWLAPTARSAATVRQRLIGDKLAACLDPGVTTFDGLADRVLAAMTTSSAQPPRSITPLVERELLRRVVDAAIEGDGLKHLAGAACRASFIDLLAEHIRELKRRGVSHAGFARTIGSRGNRRQHEELARLYADYERLLQQHGVCDDEGRHWAVRYALANEASLLAGVQLVVVDGFTDFTQSQLEILGQLARRTGRLCITLPGDENPSAGRSELFAKAAATLAELRRRHPQLTIQQLPCRATTWPALDHVAQHLFRHPRDIPSPSAAAVDSLARFEIVAAAGVQDEIVQIARHIKQQLLTGQTVGDADIVTVGGVSDADTARRPTTPSASERPPTRDVFGEGRVAPGDVVVVFRNLREAAPRVREVFREFGIPYSLEAGLPLAATGIVRTLLSLFGLDADDWPFRRVVSVVTNNLLASLDRDARTSAEWLVRDLQIASGRAELLARCEKLAGEAASLADPKGEDTYRDRQIRAAVNALPLLHSLAAALSELPRQASPVQWIAALTKLGQSLGIGCIEPTPVNADRTPSSTDDSDNHIAWQTIAKSFASLENIAGLMGEAAPQWSRDGVLRLLVDIASHESLPRQFDDAGRVRVLLAATARTVEAKHLYLAGMSEQAFPSPERSGRFYSEADYRFFANAADQSKAAAQFAPVLRSHEEMLLFYEVLTRAGERLTISYPAMDDKAQALPPSPYVTEIKRTVAPAAIARDRASSPSPLPRGSSPLSPADWRIQAVHQALEGDLALLAGLFQAGATGSTRLSSPKSANAVEAALRIIAARSRRDDFGASEGLLESDAVRERLARRFGGEHLWSPSQWEQYASCPYHFFMEDVLGLVPLGELVLETNYSRRGTLVHRVLADFHRRLPELLGGRSLLPQDAARFVAEFENVLEAMVRATPHVGVEAALVELDRRQIAKWGERYHDQHVKYDAAWPKLDTPLAPTYFEWRFGPPRSDEADYEDPRSTPQPFMLDLGREKIRVTGRIDRIDVGQAGGRIVFNVIDYKSGRRPTLTAEKIATGERLQPALYVMAAQALLFGDDAATPNWAGYWSMAQGVSTDPRFSLQCSQDQRSPSEGWESLQGEVLEQIGRFVTDIRGGNFPVVSRDDNCTSYCPFCTVCRVAHVRSLGKQWISDE